ncbi:hypothetical protein PSACC_00399 [Paramicrosporidium saccamoebae]|uniref:Uncharacterized protein n=1 Tax=Paramicrosporidium saccamoebae TaxID=1246581 RepID=A0A2H9TPV2_9FUNG|nr:hypothetical protein PSACC_00399 [Paramicrosporidium saccamoebae]
MAAGFWSGGRFLAVTAFVVAFPPVFSKFGKTEGLKLSLSVLLFYLARGLFQLLVEAGVTFGPSQSDKKRRHAVSFPILDRVAAIFVFSELPLVLSVSYAGLKYMPTWVTVPYETILSVACPLIILLEGFAAMTVILSSGQLFSESIADQSNFTKGLVLVGCILIYGTSLGVVGNLYYTGQVSNVTSATLLAIVLTLVGVLTFGTILVPHGTITDSSLVTLYAMYNIWLIARSVPRLALHATSNSLLRFISHAGWKALPMEPLAVVEALFSMFSVEIVMTLLLQMGIFLVAVRMYRRSVGLDGEEQPDITTWLTAYLWPCFGRAILVAIYTFAWLNYTRQSALPIYMDPVLWRWVNLFGCLAIYTYHLLNPTDEGGHFHID